MLREKGWKTAECPEKKAKRLLNAMRKRLWPAEYQEKKAQAS